MIGRAARVGEPMQLAGYTLIAIGFAVELVAALPVAGAPARALAWAPLRRIGTYSYGMYVLHAPLHVYVGRPLFARRAVARRRGRLRRRRDRRDVRRRRAVVSSCSRSAALALKDRPGASRGAVVIVHGDPSAPLAVVMLHGKQMHASDLAPFASSLNVPAYFVVPDAPLPAAPRGRMWWAESDATGPRELSAFDPPGRADARAHLAAIVADSRARQLAGRGDRATGRDCVAAGRARRLLAGRHARDGLRAARRSRRPSRSRCCRRRASRSTNWRPRAARLAGVPMLVTHGRDDAELAFAAGEQLRDFAIAGGARVTWLPFDGGHEIPLVVWRALRKLLRDLP